MHSGKIAIVSILVFMVFMAAVDAQLTASISAELCNIVDGVRFVVGVLALALFMLGGSVYAFSHFLPGDNEMKKVLGAWAMAMIMGGLVGMIIVLIAPNIIQIIFNVTGTQLTLCGSTSGGGPPPGGGGVGGGGGSCTGNCYVGSCPDGFGNDGQLNCGAGSVCCV